MLTGRVVEMNRGNNTDIGSYLKRMVAKSGEPMIRQAMTQAMKILGRQFVMGRTIEEALTRAGDDAARGYRHSFDMLGKSALTAADAERYTGAYIHAIAAIGHAGTSRDPFDSPGISVKLSALHPRFELAQRDRVMSELVPRLIELAAQARDAGIGLCVDAEEASRLDISLTVIEVVASNPALNGWNGFGLALQSYQKRAYAVIDWLAELAYKYGWRMMVRLVKGTYWDTEIKLSQEEGLSSYPVFTRTASTDVSYLACAAQLLATPDLFYPQIATHNAHTVAAVLEMAADNRDFEFQRLHGMGEPLYDQIVSPDGVEPLCRVYAPVGSHENLLAYLVRRLLENGANSSFVNRIANAAAPIDDIIADPCEIVCGFAVKPHPKIPLPPDLYGDDRRNSACLDLSDPHLLRHLKQEMEAHIGLWKAAPVTATGIGVTVFDPTDRRRRVGDVFNAGTLDIDRALSAAAEAAPAWDKTSADERAAVLERAADALEDNIPNLLALCIREACKTLADSVSEVREAVDFLRYYAMRARSDFDAPQRLQGPTGEANEISLHGRGVFAGISPWNFPLAIFLGQASVRH